MPADFVYRGKTQAQLVEMSMKELALLLPSRPRRSLLRDFTHPQKKLVEKLEKGRDKVETHARDMIIIPLMFNKTIMVHNGKNFVPVIIQPEMLGHFLGEFAPNAQGFETQFAGCRGYPFKCIRISEVKMISYSAPRTDKHASAMGVALPISLKQSIEICREIRGKKIENALLLLSRVAEEKESIPFKRFNRGGVGHRPGKGPARMPVKRHLPLLPSCFVLQKQMQKIKDLIQIILLSVQRLQRRHLKTMHYGRHSRRRAKRAHIELVLEEKQGQNKPVNNARKKDVLPKPTPSTAPSKTTPSKTATSTASVIPSTKTDNTRQQTGNDAKETKAVENADKRTDKQRTATSEGEKQ